MRETLEAATHLMTKLLDAVESLRSMPQRCRVVPELRDIGVADYRERLVGPYRIVFRRRGSVLEIVAVVDGRRDLSDLLMQRALFRG